MRKFDFLLPSENSEICVINIFTAGSSFTGADVFNHSGSKVVCWRKDSICCGVTLSYQRTGLNDTDLWDSYGQGTG